MLLTLTVLSAYSGCFLMVESIIKITLCKRRNETVPIAFKKIVAKHPNKTLFLFEDESWTFKEIDDYSNQVANCFSNLGYKPGDELALFMENRPEFVGIWLGLAKIGCVTSLINTNHRKDVLIHSILNSEINVKGLIYGEELNEGSKSILNFMKIKLIC